MEAEGQKAGGRVMPDRNSIIEKIKALLSKTTANGATEAEMLAALDKASAMMDAYDITDADVQVAKDEAAMLHADPPDLKDPHKIKWRLTYGIGQFCNVQIYRSRHETGLKCIGMPSDVQFAMWLLDHLADSIFAELYAHLIGCLAPPNERRIIIRSFTEACCDRINDRLLALVKRSEAARTSNGRELIVIKDAAIKAFMKDNNIRLCRGGGGYAPSNVNAAAQAAGRAAGDRASFGRPMTGAAGVLRIGR
jgi:Protein of unknown function (DUF2786)